MAAVARAVPARPACRAAALSGQARRQSLAPARLTRPLPGQPAAPAPQVLPAAEAPAAVAAAEAPAAVAAAGAERRVLLLLIDARHVTHLAAVADFRLAVKVQGRAVLF